MKLYLKIGLAIILLSLIVLPNAYAAPTKDDFLRLVGREIRDSSAWTEYKICNPTPIDFITTAKTDSQFNWWTKELKGEITDFWFTMLENGTVCGEVSKCMSIERTLDNVFQADNETNSECQCDNAKSVTFYVNKKNTTSYEKVCLDDYWLEKTENNYTAHIKLKERYVENVCNVVGIWKTFEPTKYTYKAGTCYNIRVNAKYFHNHGVISIDHALQFANYDYSEIMDLKNNIIKADWYNTSWARKKEIKLWANQSNTGSGYQIFINVTWDSDMRSDFGDVRFANESENAWLDYWIESKVNGKWALMWVELDQPITTTNRSIWMYYNNSGMTNSSNMTAVFSFAEDWDTLDWNKWQSTEHADYAVGNSILNITADVGSGDYIASVNYATSVSTKYILETKMRILGAYSDAAYVMLRTANSGAWNNGLNFWWSTNGEPSPYYFGFTWLRINGTLKTPNLITGIEPYNNWWIVRLKKLNNTEFTFTIINSTNKAVYNKTEYDMANNSLYFASLGWGGDNHQFDWIRVRKLYNGTIKKVIGSEKTEPLSIPTVTLLKPANNYNTTNRTTQFSATITDLENVTNASLWDNCSGSWSIRKTKATSGSEVNVTFTETLTYGKCIWTIEGQDASSNSDFAENRSLYIHSPIPSATLPIITPTVILTTSNINCSTTVIDGDNSTIPTNFTIWIDGIKNITSTINCANNTICFIDLSPSSLDKGNSVLCSIHPYDFSNIGEQKNSTIKKVVFSTEYTITWANSSCQQRKNLIITNFGNSDMVNYPIRISGIDTQTMILQGKIPVNCTRMLVYENQTYIHYAIVSGCNTNNTTIVIPTNVSAFTQDDDTYLYFGCGSIESFSNRAEWNKIHKFPADGQKFVEVNNTFDDNKENYTWFWNVNGDAAEVNGGVTYSNGKMVIDTGNQVNMSCHHIFSKGGLNITNNILLECKARQSSYNNSQAGIDNICAIVGQKDSPKYAKGIGFWVYDAQDFVQMRFYDSSGNINGTNYVIDYSQYHTYLINITTKSDNSAIIEWYIDGVQRRRVTDAPNLAGQAFEIYLAIGAATIGNARYLYVDNIYYKGWITNIETSYNVTNSERTSFFGEPPLENRPRGALHSDVNTAGAVNQDGKHEWISIQGFKPPVTHKIPLLEVRNRKKLDLRLSDTSKTNYVMLNDNGTSVWEMKNATSSYVLGSSSIDVGNYSMELKILENGTVEVWADGVKEATGCCVNTSVKYYANIYAEKSRTNYLIGDASIFPSTVGMSFSSIGTTENQTIGNVTNISLGSIEVNSPINPIENSSTLVNALVNVSSTIFDVGKCRLYYPNSTLKKQKLAQETSINASLTQLNCSFAMKYYETSGTYNITIIGNTTTSETDQSSATFVYNNLSAYQLSTSTINFGSLKIGESSTRTFTLKNTGNNMLSTNINGTNLTGSSFSIDVSNMIFDNESSFTNATTMTSSYQLLFNTNIQETKTSYLRLTIPAATPNDIYTGKISVRTV